MSDKQEALLEITDIMRRHALTPDEVAKAFAGGPAIEEERASGTLGRLFGYIGGTFVFAGLCIFVGMQWDHLGPAARVLLTLGPGFCAFLMALVCTTDARFEKAATPLFLIAALLEPTGILVTLHEYSHGGDPAYGLLFLHGVMAVQQGCVFAAKRRTVLALTTIYFTLGFFSIAFDLMHINTHLIGLTIGSSLICIGWALAQSRHKPLAGFIYFCGSALFLGTSWDWLWDWSAGHHRLENPLFFLLTCGTIFLSTVARSRALLTTGTLGLLAYLGDFMYEYFRDSFAAPLLLMLAGFGLIAVGALAVRINNKYIRQKGPAA